MWSTWRYDCIKFKLKRGCVIFYLLIRWRQQTVAWNVTQKPPTKWSLWPTWSTSLNEQCSEPSVCLREKQAVNSVWRLFICTSHSASGEGTLIRAWCCCSLNGSKYLWMCPNRGTICPDNWHQKFWAWLEIGIKSYAITNIGTLL